MTESVEVYRSGLFHQLLQGLVDENQINPGFTTSKDKLHIVPPLTRGIDQYVKSLKDAIDAVPIYPLSSQPGDIVAGVQNHQTSPIKIMMAPPDSIHAVSSYLHATATKPGFNIDLSLVMPESIFTDKDYQNYIYHDKRALYVSALALHLKHYDNMQYSNIYISHEHGDPSKPIIVLKPSLEYTSSSSSPSDSTIDHITPASKVLGKYEIILHFSAPITLVPLRKLAPNRNNIKTVHTPQWVDGIVYDLPNTLTSSKPSPSPSSSKSNQSVLYNTITYPNTSPTPYYNHSILHDMLSISASYTYYSILRSCPVIAQAIVVLKMWLKLRGLYADTVSPVRGKSMSQQASTIYPQLSKQYNKLLTQLKSSHKKDDNSITSSMQAILSQTSIHYNYRYHHQSPSQGITGSQLTSIMVYLYLNKKILPLNNIHHAIDAFYRFFLTHYTHDDTTNNILLHQKSLIISPLTQPIDIDDNNTTINILTTAQNDYKNILSSDVLYSPFSIVLLDTNGIYNTLYTLPFTTYKHIQISSLYSLRLLYNDNGTLFSKDLLPQHISGNILHAMISSSHIPLTDNDVFTLLFLTKYQTIKQQSTLLIDNIKYQLDWDIYSSYIQSMYLKRHNINNSLVLSNTNDFISTDDNNDDIQLLQRFDTHIKQDNILLHDNTVDITLPYSYWPCYPVLAYNIIALRDKYASSTTTTTTSTTTSTTKGKKGSVLQKKSSTSTSTSSSTSTISLQEEQLLRASLVSSYNLPLYISSSSLGSSHSIVSSSCNQYNDTTLLSILPTLSDIYNYHTYSSSSYIAQRLYTLLSTSLTNRIYFINIEPITIFNTYTYRISFKYTSNDAIRTIDRGPLADQKQKCTQFRLFWGSKSELRRFPDGAISEAVVWHTQAQPHAPEVIPQKIIEYILPLHFYTSLQSKYNNTSTSSSFIYIQSYQHPLATFVARRSSPLEPVVASASSSSSSSTAIISPYTPDLVSLPYALNDIRHHVQHVSNTLPIEQTLNTAYISLSEILREQLKGLPLSIDSIYPTSSYLRGTTPYHPIHHDITQTTIPFNYTNSSTDKNTIPTTTTMPLCDTTIMDNRSIEWNHRYHSLPFNQQYINRILHGDIKPQQQQKGGKKSNKKNKNKNKSPEDQKQQQQLQQPSTPEHTQPTYLLTSNVYEPIPLLIELGSSTKWPQHDLMAMNRIKTAFYLKIASLLRQQFPHVYTQVTSYFIDIYNQGYVFRCRIIIPGETTLFRTMTRENKSILPILLGDGSFRTHEREYIYRRQHHEYIKSVIVQHPLMALTCQLVVRWFSSHMLTRVYTHELIELITASVFVSPAPYHIPRTLFTAFLRVLHRISTYTWDNKPLILPSIKISIDNVTNNMISTYNVTSLSYPLYSYNNINIDVDINIDMLKDIYLSYQRRKSNHSNAIMYIVTPYDLESRVWSMRPATNVIYRDQVNVYSKLSSLEEHNNDAQLLLLSQKDNHNNRMDPDMEVSLTKSGNDMDDDSDHDDMNTNDSSQYDKNNPLIIQYASLIDRGDDSSNTYSLIPSPNYNDITNIIQLSQTALQYATTQLLLSISHHVTHAPSSLLASSSSSMISSSLQKALIQQQHQPKLWSYTSYLTLFKPNLSQYDAYITLDPRCITYDALKTSLFLYLNKANNNNNTIDTTLYNDFMISPTKLLLQHKNTTSDKNTTDKNNDTSAPTKQKKDKYKLPPDLVKKLEQEEQATAAATTTLSKTQQKQVQYPLSVGVDYMRRYVSDLRTQFGQIASFYYDPYGSRLIAIKFHPFWLQQHRQYTSLEQYIASNPYSLLHLGASHPISKNSSVTVGTITQDKNIISIGPHIVDALIQMSQLGNGIVHKVYTSYDDLNKDIYC